MKNRRWIPTESTTAFNFILLANKVKKGLKSRNPTLDEKTFNDLMYKSLKMFRLNDQEFDYSFSHNYLGGVRWFVKCPKCGRSCSKLYLPSEHTDRERRYLCRFCHRLKNASLLMGSSKKYRKVIKPLKRLEKLKEILLSNSMTPDKAQPLLDEYKRIEEELEASPEYRLYRFQKEHGISM